MPSNTTMTDTKLMRIAVLSIHSSPIGALGTQNTGGMSVYVRQVAKWIGSYGHRVDIFTYAQGPAEPIDLYPNVRLIDLHPGGGQDISKEALFDHLSTVSMALDRFAQTGQIKYHVIHSHYWLSGVVGAMVQKQWGCPHLTMFHTLGMIKNTSSADESEPDRRIVHELKLMESAQGIVVPSTCEQKNVVDHYGADPKKVYLIPCGVNMDRFRPMEKKPIRPSLKMGSASNVILFVGRFAPVKGLGMLLGAVAQLVPRYPQMKLVVVGGDGPGSDATLELTHEARRLGISSHLCLAGRVHHDELPAYYNAADLVAVPSFYESFGLVTLESLACGTPVAATCTGGATSVIKEGLNGTLIKKPDIASVSQGLERLLVQVRQQLFSTQKIRQSVAEHGWDRVAASLLKIYRSIY